MFCLSRSKINIFPCLKEIFQSGPKITKLEPSVLICSYHEHIHKYTTNILRAKKSHLIPPPLADCMVSTYDFTQVNFIF